MAHGLKSGLSVTVSVIGLQLWRVFCIFGRGVHTVKLKLLTKLKQLTTARR
jgi:hypothetical protein